ncbi:hypothetical protein C0Q70_12076 [Pomacea canaliculata]|uniref:Uncharacterized protein n=1 Tax=Pomacea canaliculata TaxID=400727 RepID=A0A2T7P0H7_POMCA|nr:hypothetical protein C0Q70_12076 [Pomacea canaliculata]
MTVADVCTLFSRGPLCVQAAWRGPLGESEVLVGRTLPVTTEILKKGLIGLVVMVAVSTTMTMVAVMDRTLQTH